MVDMHMELEQAVAAVYLAVLNLEADAGDAGRAVSAAKATIGRAARFIGQNAVQLHGGMGMTEELAIGHYFKRLTALQYEFGSTDHHVARYAELTRGVSLRGWLLFAAMCVIWGIPYLLIKVAVEGVSAPVVVFARTAIGVLVLVPLALSRAAWAPVLRCWKPVLVFAFFEIIAAWLLLTDAERHISSSLTGLLIAASPIIAAVLDRFTGGERRLGGKRIVGLGVGLAGVAVLAGPEITGGSAWPVSEVLLVALCYAIAPLVAARYLADVPTLPMTAACLGVAAIVYAAPAAATWPTEMPSTRVLLALTALAVICTAHRVHRVLRAHPGSRSRPRAGVHLRQSRGRAGGRSDRAQRAADPVEPSGSRVHPERVGVGHHATSPDSCVAASPRMASYHTHFGLFRGISGHSAGEPKS